MKLVTYEQASFWEETLQTVERRETRFQVLRLFPFRRCVQVVKSAACQGKHKAQMRAKTNRNNGSGEVGGVLDITPVRLGFLIINKGLSINVNHNYRFSIKLFS